MYVDTLRFDGDNLWLEMNDLNDCGAAVWDETNLDAVSAKYLLDLLEEICEYADENNDGKFCEADVDLDELESDDDE